MKYFGVFILLMSITSVSIAQQGNITGFSYNMAYTGPNTRDYVNDYSWNGFSFEYRTFRNENTSIGASVGWNMFHERTNEMVVIDKGAVSGTQTRFLGAVPMLLNAHYYFGQESEAGRPFLGINLGANYINQRFEIGVFEFNKANWHLNIAPEAGLVVPVGSTFSDTYMILSVRYNHAIAAGESLAGDGRAYSYWGFNVGFGFFTW
jgi:outer membrane protein W